MEDLGWEIRNMWQWFPWSNINNHQQEIEEGSISGSENIFLNPIQEFGKTNSTICLNPLKLVNGCQMNSHQLAPARMDSINVASCFGAASQHWSQTVAVNDFHECKNVISITNNTTAGAAVVNSLESLDCLLSATNSNADTSSDHDDGNSVPFPDYKNLCINIINNPSGVSSVDSVAKERDDGIVSQCSSERKRNNNSGFLEGNSPRSKKPRSDPRGSTSSNINFQQGKESDETDSEAIAQMKEMIYRAAAFRPVSFANDEMVEKPRRKNVRISSDPQTVAARHRREKISERLRVLQKLVPGGNKMDTASMLDEAANYLKFLRSQVKALEQFGQKLDYVRCGTTADADSTSQMIQNSEAKVTLSPVSHADYSSFTTPSTALPYSSPCMKYLYFMQ